MTNTRNALLIAACGLFLSGAAFAADPADSTAPDSSLVMSNIDADHDGTVTLAEAKAAADAKFTKLDTDKEGTLDAAELTGIVGPNAMAGANHDADHTLDKAEYLDLVQKAFDKADADHDNTLSPKELSSEPGRALVAMLSY